MDQSETWDEKPPIHCDPRNPPSMASLLLVDCPRMRSAPDLDEVSEEWPKGQVRRTQSARTVTRKRNSIFSNSGRSARRDFTLDAKKIFLMEERRRRESTYSTSRFDEDMEKLDEISEMDRLNETSEMDRLNEMSEMDRPKFSKCVKYRVSRRKREHVGFSEVTINEHQMIVGDNVVSDGVPLSIGWTSKSSVTISIDKYENTRVGHRRNEDQMFLSPLLRLQILRKLGFSREAIDRGTKASTAVRRERQKTDAGLKYCYIHEVLESANRNMQNLMTFGKMKRERQNYLAKYVSSYRKKKAMWNFLQKTEQAIDGGSKTHNDTSSVEEFEITNAQKVKVL